MACNGKGMRYSNNRVEISLTQIFLRNILLVVDDFLQNTRMAEGCLGLARTKLPKTDFGSIITQSSYSRKYPRATYFFLQKAQLELKNLYHEWLVIQLDYL